HHEGDDRLAGQVVRTADHGRFGNLLVRHQRRLDFHRAHAVTRDVQHVVDTAGDGEVTGFQITDRTVACQVELALEVGRVVGLDEAVGVVPDRADHRRPRLLDHQDAALAPGHFGTGLVDHR